MQIRFVSRHTLTWLKPSPGLNTKIAQRFRAEGETSAAKAALTTMQQCSYRSAEALRHPNQRNIEFFSELFSDAENVAL